MSSISFNSQISFNQIAYQRQQLQQQSLLFGESNPQLSVQCQLMDKKLMEQQDIIKYTNQFGGNQESVNSIVMMDQYQADLKFAMQMTQQKKTVLAYQAQAAQQTQPAFAAYAQTLDKKLESSMKILENQLSMVDQDKARYIDYYTRTGLNADSSVGQMTKQRFTLAFQAQEVLQTNPEQVTMYEFQDQQLENRIDQIISGGSGNQNQDMMSTFMNMLSQMLSGFKF